MGACVADELTSSFTAETITCVRHMCTACVYDTCTDILCPDICIRMCLEMRADMPVHMCVETPVNMSKHVCTHVQIRLYVQTHLYTCPKHVRIRLKKTDIYKRMCTCVQTLGTEMCVCVGVGHRSIPWHTHTCRQKKKVANRECGSVPQSGGGTSASA